MKKTIIKYIVGVCAVWMTSSCDDYLDVQPMDKFLESQVFSTQIGVQNALNGIYLELNNNRAYGEDLTLGAVEALAQRYNQPNSDQPLYLYQNYEYEEQPVMNKFESIWTRAYVNILNINALLEGLDKYPGVLPQNEEDLVRGECYALRAFIHFDILRLFGGVPGQSMDDYQLPYYDGIKKEAAPLISGSLFLENVLSDLEMAEEFLADDPIVGNGKMLPDPDNGIVTFFMSRHLRMNLYAVKAMQARVNQYAGNDLLALEAAEWVINNGSQWFPWTEPLAILSTPDAPDLVFSSEVIFGTYNLNLYAKFNNLFNNNLQENSVLYARPRRLDQTFENNENDYRFNSTWVLGSNHSFKTFNKYREPGNIGGDPPSFKYLLGLIRISEMYYIAAESLADSDPGQALVYLNTVRYNRGLEELALGVDIQEEIMKEYRKEFFGEGQLFFYYKRHNFSSIPNGSSNTANNTMDENTYVVPLPLSELEFRN
ncbi:RagB/SusD family nutrient uptake outer membrane protein [Algoriphagus halophytocola]|uniref:RagB/SusD family nutrient uptake outer membrane protein n=1 Tax=Algoriphagus halophytocola TaxID=2991499 RepID=A0ABY6MBW8_9BACT|nr:RagB/SusD family nutrient uptake outer membrane protein [Algoriphagus sp. TR-M5]UZD21140.1 RagB/SusD family nutrient uptake outer membrane protein [Algoriphagus sp. TR-M5]